MTDEEDEKQLMWPLPVDEQIIGFALAMAIWDLSVGCRVEPDLFSIQSDGRPKVAAFHTEIYIDAVQQARDLIPRRLEEGASMCTFAYNATETGDVERQVIAVDVSWNSGDEAAICVPWISDDGGVAWLGPLEIEAVKGTPDLLALADAVLNGLPLFDKGYRVWSELKSRPQPH